MDEQFLSSLKLLLNKSKERENHSFVIWIINEEGFTTDITNPDAYEIVIERLVPLKDWVQGFRVYFNLEELQRKKISMKSLQATIIGRLKKKLRRFEEVNKSMLEKEGYYEHTV